MSLNKYILDRFEGDNAIFLKQPNETEQVIIQRTEYNNSFKEGDIVTIYSNGESFTISLLEEETDSQKIKIQNLMKNLRNRT